LLVCWAVFKVCFVKRVNSKKEDKNFKIKNRNIGVGEQLLSVDARLLLTNFVVGVAPPSPLPPLSTEFEKYSEKPLRKKGIASAFRTGSRK